MRWIRNIAIILILMWVVGACLRGPENLTIIPKITFQSVVFKKGDQSDPLKPIFDTIVVKLGFSDGDGDLGIGQDENAIYTSPTDSTDINPLLYYVYDSAKNNIWYYTHSNNLTLPKGFHYVNYASYRNIHTDPFDTLPSSLTCKNWEIPPNRSPADTLYRQINPLSSNFFMDIYTKNADGETYTYFDLNSNYSIGGCPAVNQNRFPILSSDLGKKSALEGTITYNYESNFIYAFFHGKTLKLKGIYILDRAFHQSNAVESSDFVIK